MTDQFENNEQEFNKLLAKPDSEMIRDILEYNKISSLIFSGVLTVSQNNKLLGYFKNVVDHQGKKVYYPNGQEIDRIFIFNPHELNQGERYYFGYELASIKERKKRNNPYLLQTTLPRVKQGEKIDNIARVINEKNDEIDELNETLDQLDNTVKNYQIQIDYKEKEIAEYKLSVSKINAEIEVSKNQISEINQQKAQMENTIKILKQRINICRNLEFLSEENEAQYISLLSLKPLSLDNHLSFENEFESSFAKLADHIHHYLFHQKNLIYTPFQIRNFLTLLRTHDVIVLSGLSSSGKMQIVKAFAEALGGVAKIIPVKPNWTSSEDLIGYYNPIQMSFLPTPFTEAIVEAIHNPHQLYLICLDEMNLARVEYYFADFLSKLEERSTEPEIELYAQHEEELFISEFNILLNILESSIGGIEIKSWQDFLNNEEARTRFFKMLGNADKESLLQLHAKMKRRLIDILKFPATIKIPNNVRFIGAINVDETTHYFSPKILDRVHIVKFENPLLYEEQVTKYFQSYKYEQELKPVYVNPEIFSQRTEYPKINNDEYSYFSKELKQINLSFLLPLNIDFGVRSIRQSINYAKLNDVYDYPTDMIYNISLNSIIIQKVLPRFLFDSSEICKNGSSKLQIMEEMFQYLDELFAYPSVYFETNEILIDKFSYRLLSEMIKQAENNPQVNFFA